ncbi:probable G-protein coupled receptor 132 [Egretta garzetta]|uniref:probable G-protein coupled receptor 132 n=1 Tax=Egretta garzetta TaxID=188379 RepID=UPI00051EF445|nr:probable G-protein coupled receptor 132 [Egretta garzetta]XP_035756296.1 probable G-protein coupled receptor 132 [Egretta garzetta]XP_035756297.1 probable G-protein coupled receptor 132 [Egretta garzetta]XP_035756298.1 probable G-protein coupled receptor 132 [Egretta garzetta]
MENCTQTSDNCTGIPSSVSKIPLVAVYSIVFAIGLPANCLTSLLTFQQIRKNKVIAVYLFSLSLCELMYLSTLPLWIIYVNNKHRWTMGENTCKVTGFIFFCNIYISILLLCCISVDRYVAVVYALESRGKRGQKKAFAIVSCVFAVVAIIYSPTFYMEDNNTDKICFETLPLNIKLASLNFARFLFGFAIPFTILIFTNYKIFQSTKTSSSLTSRQKAKVKYLAIAIIVIFLICFAPYHVVLLIRSTYFLLHQNSSCPFEREIYTTFTVFLCLVTANSIADPIIYVLVSENIRKDFCRTLRRWRLNSSINQKTDSIKLKMSKESQEGGLREENKETPHSSDIEKTCSSGKDQEGGS